ncbi:protease HtpX [Magnetococcus sp. PR-3]|uniref:protease HtpX n=1 Tax=Magnetococcus sp. PR-3 TaxID=3120355 RepID=UPI002FCE5E92
MKRIILFILTNLAIMAVLMVVAQILINVLGIQQSSMLGMLLFSALFGMGGSFLSLAMSKWIAKRSTGARVIEHPSNAMEQWLVNTVSKQAKAAGIGRPEVALYDSPDMNAFATGANKNKALVAVSSELLRTLSKEEAEAVLAHEVSHIANGDMVTLALIQGVLNTFVFVLARMIAGVVDLFLSGDEDDEEATGTEGGLTYFIVSLIAQILLGMLASIVVMWFSRKREFRADAGGAALSSRQSMISALERLKQSAGPSQLPSEVAAFGLSSSTNGFMHLFSTHPPLEERINALKQAR